MTATKTFKAVRQVFLVFQVSAERFRFSEGRDELSVEDLVERLKITKAEAERAIAILAESNCIEISLKGQGVLKYRFIPGSKAPDELDVQTSAQPRKRK